MGGGSGSGGMLRTVGSKIVTRTNGTVQEKPFSSSSSSTTSATSSSTRNNTHNPNFTSTITNNNNNPFSLSSSHFSSYNTIPISANSNLKPNWPHCDEFEWVSSVDGSESDEFSDDFVLGSVPSTDEVLNAISVLQQAQLVRDRYGSSSNGDAGDHISSPNAFESDGIEPSMQLCNSRMLQANGANRVYDAFHLLQTDKSVQRMVISLSSDNAVWDAVLNNEMVRELRESLDTARDNSVASSESEVPDTSDSAMSILQLIFDSTKAKATGLIGMIFKILNGLFKTEKPGGPVDPFDEKLRSSFLLSIVVLLVVVVSRAHRA